jgi:hypothetical protein
MLKCWIQTRVLLWWYLRVAELRDAKTRARQNESSSWKQWRPDCFYLRLPHFQLHRRVYMAANIGLRQVTVVLDECP